MVLKLLQFKIKVHWKISFLQQFCLLWMEIPCSIKLGKLLVFPISTKAEKPVREPSRLVRRWNHRCLSRPYWQVQSCKISRKINRFYLWVTLLNRGTREKPKKTRQSTFAILSLSNQKTSDEKDFDQPHEARIQKELLNATSTGWVLTEQQIPVQRRQNSGKEYNIIFLFLGNLVLHQT